jgi:hypothetical protein
MPTERVRALMAARDSPAFQPVLLRRFINLVGLFPVGTLVRLNTEEIALVTREHPGDPFRPQVKILLDRRGDQLAEPFLVNTWEEGSRGDHTRAVVEAVDEQSVAIDPAAYV